MERTEEQILTRAPIVLILGGEKYPVPVLTIAQSIAWRQKLIASAEEIMRPLMKPLERPLWKKILDCLCFWRPKRSTADTLFAGLGTAFIAFPEMVLDLLCEYAPDLPQKKIRETATEEEMFAAFSAIVASVNPLQRQISLIKSVTNPSLLEKFTSFSSPNTAAIPPGSTTT